MQRELFRIHEDEKEQQLSLPPLLGSFCGCENSELSSRCSGTLVSSVHAGTAGYGRHSSIQTISLPVIASSFGTIRWSTDTFHRRSWTIGLLILCHRSSLPGTDCVLSFHRSYHLLTDSDISILLQRQIAFPLSTTHTATDRIYHIQTPRVITAAAHSLWYHSILLVPARRGISCRNIFVFHPRIAGVQCPVPLFGTSDTVWILTFCGFDHCQWTGRRLESETVW